MKSRWVLPKSIRLPGGFKITIVETALTNDENANFAYSSDGVGIISLKKGLTQAQQKYYFAHELQHALIDYMHTLVLTGAGPGV